MPASGITAIIIAKNEAAMLPHCLKTLAWANRIMVVDSGSDDKTAKIAEDAGAKVIHFSHPDFDRLRNEALNHIETDWLFYIDADERVSPTLAKEILVHIETEDAQVMAMKRKNICYGREFKHGGWEEDEVTRVFKQEFLKKWQGRVHETPVYDGKKIVLHSRLLHLTHRSTVQGLQKTIEWTPIEAELLYKSKIDKVSFFTIIRKGIMEFIRRGIIKQGYKDGLPGLIEALTQGINKMLVYIQVWELQQSPSLPERYRKHDIELAKEWEQEDIEALKLSTKE